LRGSMPSTPDIGHALAQLPQVMQELPLEGSSNSFPDGFPSRRTFSSCKPISRLISGVPGTCLSFRAERSIPNSWQILPKSASETKYRFPDMERAGSFPLLIQLRIVFLWTPS